MDKEKKKIKSFTDLIAWAKSHELVLEIYTITKKFPREEVFGITNQMRRCAVSVTSDIAEGFSRKTYKDKTQFYSIALGSLTELQNQLLVTRDVHYITETTFQILADKTVVAHKLINGLIKSSRSYG